MALPDKPAITTARWRFVGLTYVLALVLVGANLPTPLYRVYQGLLGFDTGVLTTIFAAYVVGVIVGLLVAAGASDRLGRKALLISAAIAAVAGGAAFILAGGVGWLLAARALTGLATGLITSVVPSELFEFEPRGEAPRATLVVPAVTVGGLASGPMFTALLMQYAPWPTRLVYVCYLVALIPAAVAIAVHPRRPAVHFARGPVSWLAALRPRRPLVPEAAKEAFRHATLPFVAGWVGTALFFSLGPTLAEQVLRTSDNLVIAGVVLIVFVTSAIVQLVSRSAETRVSIIGGLAILAAGMGLVPMAVAVRSSAVLVVAALAVGAGQGLSHRAAEDEITRSVPFEQRAQAVAAFFITGYAGIAVLIIGLGIAIDHYGLLRGLWGFALLVCALALAGLWQNMPRLRSRRTG